MRCKLTGVGLTDAVPIDTTFGDTLLISPNLRGWSFHGATMDRFAFPELDLKACDLWEAKFQGYRLRRCRFDGARFEGADLRARTSADFGSSTPGLLRDATVSHEQAGQLLGELGLKVR